MTIDKFLEASKDYWKGVFSMVDDDLPDGAYMQVRVDMAESQLDDCCEMLNLKRPANIDGHDIAFHNFD